MSGTFETFAEPLAALESALDARLQYPPDACDSALLDAMRYAVLGGGKRVRGLLVLLTGAALDQPRELLLPAACAVEFIHAYSLIHDDLPAMDDDDIRRGKPSTHRAFGEANAILAGDALQALAFETVVDNPPLDPACRLAQCHNLALASGPRGMVGGQTLDMAAENQPIDQAALERIHRLKTGALLETSVLLAADTLPTLPPQQRGALQAFAQHLGLAFQVQDDLLDLQSSTAALGKPQGSDLARGKATYPALMGEQQASRYAGRLHAQALASLASLPQNTAALEQLVAALQERSG